MKSTSLLIATFTVMLASANAVSADARLESLARCLAYYAVTGGLGGQADVPSDKAEIIALMGEEFMFEAKISGLDDDTAHTMVVNKLMAINLVARESGMEQVHDTDRHSCEELARELAP